jgi:DNA-directed RNA polymerase subunit K/omega
MSVQIPSSRFEFVVMASRRAHQLLEGCRPKVDGDHKPARLAQREVKSGALWAEQPEATGDKTTFE